MKRCDGSGRCNLYWQSLRSHCHYREAEASAASAGATCPHLGPAVSWAPHRFNLGEACACALRAWGLLSPGETRVSRPNCLRPRRGPERCLRAEPSSGATTQEIPCEGRGSTEALWRREWTA